MSITCSSYFLTWGVSLLFVRPVMSAHPFLGAVDNVPGTLEACAGFLCYNDC